MKTTGERFSPGQTGQIELDHFNRYYFVINQINLTDKVVLDLASGEGYGSDLLAKYSKQVIGIDIDGEVIEYANSKYIKDNLNFIVGDAVEIPLLNRSIDVVVSFETLEHLDNHDKMLGEIKRVLKPDGILVMSSPDKYYYSDLPKYRNEFHIKELYYEDYKILIKKYFINSLFYSQRIFVGSIITREDEQSTYKKPLVVEKDGNAFDFTPIFNLAIGTDNIGFCPVHQQILFKESDFILTKKDVDRSIQSIRNSRPFRLGNFIISPLRFIKKILFK